MMHGTTNIKFKVKYTLVRALRLCTGRAAYRGSRGIALPFHDHGTGRGWRISVTPRSFFTPRERPGTRCTWCWVGPGAGLDRCGKPNPHQDSIPGPSSPQPVAIPSTLPGPPWNHRVNWIGRSNHGLECHFRISNNFTAPVIKKYIMITGGGRWG